MKMSVIGLFKQSNNLGVLKRVSELMYTVMTINVTESYCTMNRKCLTKEMSSKQLTSSFNIARVVVSFPWFAREFVGIYRHTPGDEGWMGH